MLEQAHRLIPAGCARGAARVAHTTSKACTAAVPKQLLAGPLAYQVCMWTKCLALLIKMATDGTDTYRSLPVQSCCVRINPRCVFYVCRVSLLPGCTGSMCSIPYRQNPQLLAPLPSNRTRPVMPSRPCG